MPRGSLVRAIASAAVLSSMVACAPGPLGDLVRPPSPSEQYADSLRRSGLDQTALGRDWLRASDEALQRPADADLPFSETGYFAAETPSAAAYRFEVAAGRQLAIDVTFDAVELGRLFVDLFRLQESGAARPVSSMAAEARSLTYEVNEAATFVLRVQPELLRGGRYTLTERTLSTIVFPVSGVTARGVQSGFGAVRDAGERQHEGVDIFAPAGTPVVAVTGGVARTGTNALGGNVVWLQPASGRRTFYYAHLDRWAFDGTAVVAAGDPLGFVGNTGNARTTAPHLHFGIYQRGPVDPLPFVQPDDPLPAPPPTDWTLGSRARVRAVRAFLRTGPAAATERRRPLERGTLMTVIAANGRAMRVRLPDDTIGYVTAADLTPADAPLLRRRLAAGTALRDRPSALAPAIREIGAPAQAEVLGTFDGFAFVRLADTTRGWVAATSAAAD